MTIIETQTDQLGSRIRHLDALEEMNRAFEEERRMAHDLRAALANGQFRVHYQPVVAFPGARLVAVEALVRWEHPERGLVPPLEFIPAAEQCGVIVDLGRWVLEEACCQTRRWQLTVPELCHLRVAVNVSARQLTPDLVRVVHDALERSGLAGDQLELEITESAVMADVERSLAILDQLAELGVGLSIDDFGTGFSSLSYLKRMPVTGLKIDKSFIDDLTDDSREVSIVAAIIALAAALGLNQIAEGVETEAQRRQLEALGCAQAQGYLFSRPLPADAFVEATRELAGAERPDGDEASDPVRVLICDDEPAIRGLYRRALQSLDTEVVEVGDAEQCLAEIRRFQADLVILDIDLPGRSGLEILPELRAAAPGARVVVVSGAVPPETASAALALGADSCEPKMQFLPLVHQLVESCRPRSSNQADDPEATHAP
jgi:EAL domain-containing protein (putative c-di-GMP-specific phosphodiesterase class I)